MVTLRPAEIRDWARLYAWRNDDATRAASLETEPVDLKAHMRWLEKVLVDADTRLWVAEDATRSVTVGTGRHDLHREGGGKKKKLVVECSLTIDPQQRGRGYAQQLLGRLIANVVWDDAEVLVAHVRQENHTSLRVFAAAGFSVANVADGVVRLERPCR